VWSKEREEVTHHTQQSGSPEEEAAVKVSECTWVPAGVREPRDA
jgi:hypothetical protein